MGYSLSWVAVRGKPAVAVHTELGLGPTRRTLEVPEGDFCAAALEDGWSIVLTNVDARFVDDDLLARLSAGCEVVGCFVEEHVMVSQASGFREGKREWVVAHQAELSLDHLEVEGTPPDAFPGIEAALRARRKAEPKGPDFLFDVPVELAKALTGFAHHAGELSFEELELLNPPPRKSWLQKLLGR